MSNREPIPDTPMRLVKIECTGNENSAIGYVPEADDERILDWVMSWLDDDNPLFEGKVYVACNVPPPADFPLEWGAFYFYVPPVEEPLE